MVVVKYRLGIIGFPAFVNISICIFLDKVEYIYEIQNPYMKIPLLNGLEKF